MDFITGVLKKKDFKVEYDFYATITSFQNVYSKNLCELCTWRLNLPQCRKEYKLLLKPETAFVISINQRQFNKKTRANVFFGFEPDTTSCMFNPSFGYCKTNT